MSQTPVRILVIGAGAAGLLLAQVLKKHNIPCTVFEQDPGPKARPRDWNYGIYWAQSPLSEWLPQELADRLLEVQVDSHVPSEGDVMPIFDASTGERLVDLPSPHSLRFRRRLFLELIATGIDVRYGKHLVDVKSDGKVATASFGDGTEETGTLLVGAEGAHSKVREYLVGKDRGALCPSSIVASATIAKLPSEVALRVAKLHYRNCIAFHPNGHFLWFGIHNRNGEPKDWEWMIILSWASPGPPTLSGNEIWRDIKEKAAQYAEPFRTALQSIPKETTFWHNRLSYWATQSWDDHNGTVTLVGDAAHAMTFHRGQGLNNAILDAAFFGRQLELLDVISPASLSATVRAYQEEVWPRGKEVVEAGNENSESIHNWDTLQNSPLFKAGLKQSHKD